MEDKLQELKSRLIALDKADDDSNNRLGNTAYAAAADDDNYMGDIGKSLYSGLMSCSTQRDFDYFNRGVTAICGYGIESMISMMEKTGKGE